MASRYVFTANKPPLSLDFEWMPGMSTQQRRKSCMSLHNTLYDLGLRAAVLDISSASTEKLGVALSAFNLETLNAETGEMNTVECLYQGSKKFTSGKRANHLYGTDSLAAKKFEAPASWGVKDGFIYNGREFAGRDASKFYNWIYIDALVNHNRALAEKILEGGYVAFTDIQLKHIPDPVCQAKACAQFVEFVHRYGSIDAVAENIQDYEGYMFMLSEHEGGLKPRELEESDISDMNLRRIPGKELKPYQISEDASTAKKDKAVKVYAPYTYGLYAHGFSEAFIDTIPTTFDSAAEWDAASLGFLLGVVLRHRLAGGEYVHNAYPEFCAKVLDLIPEEWLGVRLTNKKPVVFTSYELAQDMYYGLSPLEQFIAALSLNYDQNSNVAANLLHIACAYDCVCVVERLLDKMDVLLPADEWCVPLVGLLAEFRSYECEKLLYDKLIEKNGGVWNAFRR